MSQPIEVTIHEVATDGLPDMDELTGRVAFIFDGCIVSGWPLGRGDEPRWEANSDVGNGREFAGITHWIKFPAPLWEIERLVSPGWHTNLGYLYDTTSEAYAAGRNSVLDALRHAIADHNPDYREELRGREEA